MYQLFGCSNKNAAATLLDGTLALPTLQDAAGCEKTYVGERGKILVLNVDREAAVMFMPRARAEAGQSIRESPLSGAGHVPNVPFRIKGDVAQGNAKSIFGEARITLGESMDSGLISNVCGTLARCFSGANVARIAGQKGRYSEDISRHQSPQKNPCPSPAKME
jgi:hypothetical protein